MIRDLIFRPMFNAVDWFTTTLAGALCISGHWLASIPVFAVGVGLYALARRKGWDRPAPFYAARKGR